MADIVADQIRAESARRKAEAAEQQRILGEPGPTQAKADVQRQIQVERLRRQIAEREYAAGEKPGGLFEHGVTFGLDVPLSGLADAIGGEFNEWWGTEGYEEPATFGERYEAGEKQRRLNLAIAGAESPAPILEEGLGTLAAGPAGAAERFLATRASRPFIEPAAKTGVRTMLEGLGLGAGTGFVHGASTGEGDWRDRVLEGTKEAAIGGVAASLLAPLSGRIGQALDYYFAQPSVRARQTLYEIGRREGLTPQRIDDLITTYGPETMAIDVGEAARGAARSAANVSPEAREIMAPALAGREAGGGPRLAADVQTASGLSPGDRRTVQDITEQSYAVREPAINAAYDVAREAGQDLPREPFRQILETPMGAQAYETAATSLLNRQGFNTAGRGGVTGELARLDQTKQELDAIAATAARLGDNNRAAQASGLAALLRQRVDEVLQDPVYAEARALRAAAFREEEAIQTGADIAGRTGGGIGGPAAAAQFTDPAELAGLRAGYGQATAEDLLTSTGTAGRSALTTPLATETRTAVLGPGAPTVENAIARERRFSLANEAVRGNSTTARQLIEAGMGGGGAGGLTAMLLGLPPMTAGLATVGAGAASAGIRAAVPWLERKLATAGREATGSALAQMLMQSPRGIPFAPVISPVGRNTLTRIGNLGARGFNQAMDYLARPPAPVEILPEEEDHSMLENDYPVPVELTDPRDILRRRGLSYG